MEWKVREGQEERRGEGGRMESKWEVGRGEVEGKRRIGEKKIWKRKVKGKWR